MVVGIVSQWVNNHLGYFNAISGKRDGDYSVHRAQLRNQPKGTAIYSAVDYDAQPSDMTQIKAFFTPQSPFRMGLADPNRLTAPGRSGRTTQIPAKYRKCPVGSQSSNHESRTSM